MLQTKSTQIMLFFEKNVKANLYIAELSYGLCACGNFTFDLNKTYEDTKELINSQEYINKHSFILHDSKREKYILENKNMLIKCGNTARNTEESVIRQIQITSKYLQDNYIIIGHEEVFRYNFIFRDVINSENIVMKVTLHLWTFKTPIFTELKKSKNVKSILMVLLFLLLFFN
jgi:hypothetical protein